MSVPKLRCFRCTCLNTVTQAFIPCLIRSKSVIVNHSSISSVTNVPYNGIYNASKAAVAIMTDTLRLELEPFDVKVVELKTGAVKSTFYQNSNTGAAVQLPPHSIYQPAKVVVEKSMSGTEIEADAVSTDTWANDVASELTQDKINSRVWKGHNAAAVRIASRFMGPDFLNSNMRKLGSLNEVKQALSSNK